MKQRKGQQKTGGWQKECLLFLLLMLCAFLGGRALATGLPGESSSEAVTEASAVEEPESGEESTEGSAAEEESPAESEPSGESTEPSGGSEESSSEEESTETETETEPETEPIPQKPYIIPYRSFSYDDITETVRLAVVHNATAVNLREGPGTEYEVLGIMNADVMLEIIGEATSSQQVLWYKVRTYYEVLGEEVIGYVSSNVTRTLVLEPGLAYETYLSYIGFPDAYLPYLLALHEQYPQWVFTPSDAGDWDTVLYEEANPDSYPGISLIHPYSISSWKLTRGKYYDWTTSRFANFDGSWNAASDELVAYYLDPRTYLDETAIFTMLDQRYDEAQVLDGVKTILRGTFMDAETATDVDGTEFNYAEVFCEIGRTLGVSPYFLASCVRQEIGVAGTSKSISGLSEKYPGYYNYFNVYAATTATEDANDHGLWFASGAGVGATSYNRPWDTRIKGLWGGAMYLAENYILKGQNTLYYKRFNVKTGASSLYRHQFMTNTKGAWSEGVSLANGYGAEERQQALRFDIPIYVGLPEEPCPCPTGDGSPNNRLASVTLGEYELVPAFSYDVYAYSVIVEAESAQVLLEAEAYDGTALIEGAGELTLQEGTNLVTLTVTAENGDVLTYELSIYFEYAEAEKPLMECVYPLSEDNVISGIRLGTDYAEFAAGLGLSEKAVLKLFAADGSEKGEGALIATGDTVTVLDQEEQVFFEGRALIYGDVNGDGKISMADLIKVRNQILETASLEGQFGTAADVNRDGKVSMADLIRIRNQILDTQSISQ